MCIKILNTLGLVFSIIGTVFVFVWGVSYQTDSTALGYEDGAVVDTKWGEVTVKEMEEKQNEEMLIFRDRSRAGLGLMAFGFLCQLIATWMPN